MDDGRWTMDGSSSSIVYRPSSREQLALAGVHPFARGFVSVIVAEQVQDAVYQQGCHVGFRALAGLGSLLGGAVVGYGDVAQVGRALGGDHPTPITHRE